MGAAVDFPSFGSGEISPNMMGRVDLARMKSSATTMRNMFVRFTGGAFSRAGTSFVGYSKQTGRQYPPRLIPFQFNNDQGLALEFGHQYMRVIFNGAFVTEAPLAITNITQGTPGVVTAPSIGAIAATPVNGGVTSSYTQGDIITLAGGAFSIAAQVTVSTTMLLSISPLNGAGQGYAPGDTATLAGGTFTAAAAVTINTTHVNAATIANAGTGGTPGTALVTGTTGTGTKFKASVTISSSGVITTVNSISLAGSYTVNPTTPSAEPVTGGGLTGATLNLAIGPATVTVTTPGAFSANPGGGIMSQSATSGAGTGAKFLAGLFAPNSVTVSEGGSYSAFPANPVSQAATSGAGVGAQFTVNSGTAPAYNVGDWLFITGVGGMAQMNGRTVVVAAVSHNSYSLNDVFGAPIDTTGFPAYTGGGSISRIYTLTTPWAEQDLPFLKFTESADTLSFCCVNQISNAEYPPQDIVRNNDSNWTIKKLNTAPSILPPASVTLSITPTPSGATAFSHYQYAVTAISLLDQSESIASPIGDLPSGVDIAAYAGSVTINAGQVAGAARYNFYKATPGFSYTATGIPAPAVGSQFGYIGYSYGPQMLDTNISPDFTKLPPLHQNPFARGQLINVNPVSIGGAYTTATATINSGTGSGAVVVPVIQNGQIVAYVVNDPGQNYLASDTVTITGDGGGATASLSVGPQSGTYPGVVSYYQQRRAYAFTLNNPNTYFMSGTGVYTNFDYRIPTIDTDSIIGTPWAQQVNGVQFMLSMPGGLVVLTGLGAWQVTGAGGSSFNPQPITPANQIAQPQTYNGCSSTVPPIRINSDIIYVQSKGSNYRDLSYQFFTNIYTGTDLTIYASHLFQNYTIIEHAWAEEPYKIIWAVRSDGALLSLTYLREQEITGWARHDTNGLFKTICTVVEPPVDAIYVGVLRQINARLCYMIERFDNRLWTDAESTWCVDSGLSTPMTYPAFEAYIDYPNGIGAISGATSLVGGQGYSSATTAQIVDANGIGPGYGATATLTVVGGVITDVVIGAAGQNYTSPVLILNDPTGQGSGASATLILNTTATVNVLGAIFTPGYVGVDIRMGGGKMSATKYLGPTQMQVTVIRPVNIVGPEASGLQIFQPGQWSMAWPIAQVTGLYHLANTYVSGLADGKVIPPTLVSNSGTLTLAAPASSITIGLTFQAQLQTSRLDVGEPSTQGQRKKVAQVTVRAQNSRSIKIGANQVDGSNLSPPQIAPVWNDLQSLQDLSVASFQDPNFIPLWTGDQRALVGSNWGKAGQIALQQDYPLPMEILSVIPEYLPGDTADTSAKGQQKRAGGR